MVVFPNAKINIGLDILRKRADGYHDIATVMMPVPWYDVLEIVPSISPDDSIHISGREVKCAPEDNLVMKAVKAMRAVRDFPAVDIYLHKVIPDGAGLGGGSADAAFAITLVNDLFALGLDKTEMAAIAARIGADCPFFIYNRPMLCTGTGTDMEPIDNPLPPGLLLMIVKPAVSVPTKDAYASVRPAVPAVPLSGRLAAVPFTDWRHAVQNGFETSVFPKYPVVSEVKERMYGLGAVYASMSGSGSAVFGLFNGDDIMSESPESVFPGCDILVGRL